MAHVHVVDGTAHDADTFGETESTSGIWKPKTSPSVTYGTNGCFLKFQDSSSLGDDSSGNTNDFTLTNTGIQILDTPSNVFATGNPLATNYASGLAKGNNEWTSNQTGRGICQATLGVSKGKWYWEVKTNSTHGTNSSDQWNYIGIANGHAIDGDNILGTSGTNSNKLYEYALYAPDGGVYNNGSKTSYGASFTEGDILSFALDLDNNRCYAAKNGQWCNSGAWSASSPTTYFSVTDPDSTKGGFYFPAVSDGGSNVYKVWQFNFGNGYFGTTAISSAENDDAGYGKFEYDVPAGYYALCTKNINNYG